uniref:Glyco_transf_64 domain-containing protein n=1 Tax=Mesocestoides corti TaxID=53468 RepID=A0A5K3G201_MESCO
MNSCPPLSVRNLILGLLVLFACLYVWFSSVFLHLWTPQSQVVTYDATLRIDSFSEPRSVFHSNKKLETEIREMMRIHASMNNEMVLIEQTRRSLIRSRYELEAQVMRLRTDAAVAEQHLLRLQTTLASYQKAAAFLSVNSSNSYKLAPLSVVVSASPSTPSSGCDMSTCFNWTACPFHSLSHLRVCFHHESAISDSRWHRALLTSPHFSTSCKNACVRVIFAPENCTGISCLYIGTTKDTMSPYVMRASSTRGVVRPGYDFVLSPLVNSTSERPPMVVNRRARWLLGASLGTSGPADGKAAFLMALRADADAGNLVNVRLRNASDECLTSSEALFHGTWRPCHDSNMVLGNSTFCLLVDNLGTNPADNNSGELGEQLATCLSNGAVPVFASNGAESRLFPFWEVLEPQWRQAVIFIPRARLPHLVYFLKTVDENTRIEMQLQGQRIWRKYLNTAAAQLATLFLALSRRLGLPQPPAPVTKSVPAFRSGSFHPERFYKPRAQVLSQVDVDGLLGPLGPQWDSPPAVQSVFTHSSLADPFWRHPSTPFTTQPLPTEFQFIEGATSNFRPINHTWNTAGKEFAADLGGMFPYEQFTIVVLTYDRESVLTVILEGFMNLPYLHSVVVVWNNPQPPSSNLLWPELHVPIYVVRTNKNSLNNRFLPFDIIKTEALLMLDDDVTLRHDEIILAFRIWRENRDRIVGFPARGHFWSSASQSWYYNSAHACEYSMVLTGAAFIHRYYLHAYTTEMPTEIRQRVDEELNCEDVAMNFLVSHITRKPPIKVSKLTQTCLCIVPPTFS